MDPFKIAAGVLMLVLGRRLLWLFIGLLGFWAGLMLGAPYFGAESGVSAILLALVFGVVGVVLAIFLQKLAIALAGFLAGGYTGVTLAGQFFQMNQNQTEWIVFIAAGIAGAILLSLVFDWALIFLSSVTGSLLVIRGIPVSGSILYILFSLMCVIGILIQAGILMRQRKHAQSASG